MVAAVPGVRYYLTEVPTQLADDYRESAEPAVERMTDAMDKTFEAFDNYLDNSTLPAREVRNAEEIDEIQRRFLPLYDDTEEALKAADRAIGKARQTLAAQRKKLGDVPSAPLLGGKPEVVAAEETIGPTERFVAESKAFLRNFQAFVDFDRKAVDLRRADIEGLDDEAITAADSLEELKAATSASLAEAEKSRERYLDLEPHPDQRKLHELYTEQVTVLVDYYSDVLEAYESLSIPALDAADAEFLASLNGMGKKESYQLQLFASNSSLQKQSRRLEEAGDRLEKRIAGLGSGEAELSGGDVYRPSAPPPPPKPGGKGDDKGSDRSVS